MAGSRQRTKRRLKLWNRNPNCFWCGVETTLDTPQRAATTATLDHIRSRYCSQRAERGEKWQRGIVVLACFRCNNERCRMEQAFFAKHAPDRLHKKNGSKPAPRELTAAQSKLCNAVLAYLKHGGKLDPGTLANKLTRCAANVKRWYGLVKAIRKPNTEG